MKKSVAITVIAILAIAAIALGVLYYTNNDSKTKEIAARDADIADKAGQIETLNADVADKAGQIETLNADVAGKAGEIEKLTEDVSSRDGQIDTLNKLVDTKNGEIEALNADVAEKAGQIETLNADVADKAGQIEALNADVTDKAGQIVKLNEDVAYKAGQIDVLSADVTDKAGQIETLSKDVADKASQIELLNTDVANKAGQIDTLNAEITDKSGQIEVLNTIIDEKNKKIDELNAVVTEQKEEIQRLNEAIKANSSSSPANENVMSYAEFVAAELDTPVCIEAYVQSNQSWWDGKIKLYMQDENHGGYFIYDMYCTEKEAASITVPGTKLRIKGIKAEWSGEVEIIDATYEVLSGFYIAKAEDVTDLFGKDELIYHINEKIAVKGARVVGKTIEGQEGEFAFLYAWDDSGSRESNSDLYFDVEIGGQVYSFVVESYMCGNSTYVYKAVENLKVGDVVDLKGFLYWYNGPNPHINSVTVK